MKDILVFQSQTKGCGYASVKMALCKASKKRCFRYLEEPFIHDQAPSLAELIQYGKKHGLLLSAFKLRDPRGLLENDDYPLLMVLNESGRLHMVYVAGHRGRHFLVLDPARGKRRLSDEEMFALCEGSFLKVLRYVDMGERVKKPRIIPIYQTIMLCMFPLLQACLLVLGFYFFGGERENPLIAALSFCGVALALLGQNALQASFCKDFDDRYLAKADERTPSRRKEMFDRYFEMKGLVFSTLPSLFTKTGEAVLLWLLFGLNDLLFAFLGAIATLIVIVGALVFDPWYEKRARRLENNESEYLLTLEDETSRKARLRALSASASSLAASYWSKKVAEVFLIAFVTLGILIIQDALSLSNFLFDFLAATAVASLEESAFAETKRVHRRRELEGWFSMRFIEPRMLTEKRKRAKRVKK